MLDAGCWMLDARCSMLYVFRKMAETPGDECKLRIMNSHTPIPYPFPLRAAQFIRDARGRGVEIR